MTCLTLIYIDVEIKKLPPKLMDKKFKQVEFSTTFIQSFPSCKDEQKPTKRK